MRRVIISGLAALLFGFAGCVSNEVSSREVAEKFLKAYTNKRFEEAKNYATANTKKMVELASNLHKIAPKKDTQNIDLEIIEHFEQGNRATVIYRRKGQENREAIYLVKQNDSWLVGMK